MATDWESAASSDDVKNLYKVLLGRAAEAEVLQNYKPMPIGEVARGLACSKEFKEQVLQAVMQALDVPHDRMAAAELTDLEHWLGARLLLPQATVSGLGGAAGLLNRVFADPGLAASMLQSHGPLFIQGKQRVELRLRLLEDLYSKWAASVPSPEGALLESCMAWDATATEEDLHHLYLAFLGRPVEKQIIDNHEPRALRGFMHDFARSTELGQCVLHALVQKRELPHEKLLFGQLEQTEQWLSERLCLPSGAAAANGTPASILNRLLSHPGMAENLLRHHGSLWTQAAEELVQLLRAGRSRFKGHIEFVNREFISGFLVDVAGEAQHPQLEIRCEGRVVSSGASVIFRPDIQLHFGGDGLAGFRTPWNSSVHPNGISMLTLHVAASGLQVGPPYSFENHFLDQLSLSQELAKQFDEIKRRLDALASMVPNALSFSAFPAEHYDLYRRTHRVPPPPMRGQTHSSRFFVLLDAADANATAVRISIDSLRHQAGTGQWQLWVIGGNGDAIEVADLLGTSLPHVHRTADWAQTTIMLRGLGIDSAAWVVLLQAGEMLDPQSLNWLHTCHAPAAASALYWDEDRLEHATGRLPAREPRHTDPILRSRFDPDSMLELNIVGTSFAVRADVLAAAADMVSMYPASAAPDHPLCLAERERLIWAIWRNGTWAHIPQLLLTQSVPPAQAHNDYTHNRLICHASPEALAPLLPLIWQGRAWRRVADPIAVRSAKPLVRWDPDIPQAVISVLIPTRDHVALLQPCVESLLQMAYRPDLIEIIIADNGSSDPATLKYLAAAAHQNHIKLVRIDEPFNWSRLNNQMATLARGRYLLFLNNDTRMLTREWDQILRGLLERQDVGAVGARLLYEDMTIQHAGVVISPHRIVDHYGLGREANDALALLNTQLTHAVSAATGACLATTAETFLKVGNFDEESLSITFNDVDWCLRVIQLGLTIIYSPLLTMVHLESKSRGFDFMSRKKQSRAEYELKSLLSKHPEAFKFEI